MPCAVARSESRNEGDQDNTRVGGRHVRGRRQRAALCEVLRRDNMKPSRRGMQETRQKESTYLVPRAGVLLNGDHELARVFFLGSGCHRCHLSWAVMVGWAVRRGGWARWQRGGGSEKDDFGGSGRAVLM